MNTLGLGSVEEAREILRRAGQQHEVAGVLEEVLVEAVRAYEQRELARLDASRLRWAREAEAERSGYATVESKLFNDTLQANVQAKKLLQARRELALDLEGLETQTQSLKEEEDRLLSREDQKRARRDISLLPVHVLRRVVSFLGRGEFARTLSVSRRWRYTLDQAFLWKVFMVRFERRAMEEKTRVIAAATAKREVPPQIELKIECKKVERSLQKGEIFEACLEAQADEGRLLARIQSELERKVRANASNHHFLSEQLKALDAKLGQARVELSTWEKKAHDSAVENKLLAQKMHDSEMRMQEELRLKKELLESTGRNIADINTRIGILREIHQEIGKDKDGMGQSLSLREQVAKKKGQKKVLKTTVLSLRSRLEKLVIELSKLRKIAKIAGAR